MSIVFLEPVYPAPGHIHHGRLQLVEVSRAGLGTRGLLDPGAAQGGWMGLRLPCLPSRTENGVLLGWCSGPRAGPQSPEPDAGVAARGCPALRFPRSRPPFTVAPPTHGLALGL